MLTPLKCLCEIVDTGTKEGYREGFERIWNKTLVNTTYPEVRIVQGVTRRITIIGKLSLKVIIRITVQRVSSTVTKTRGFHPTFKNTGAS
jgi:hypothetical protein